MDIRFYRRMVLCNSITIKDTDTKEEKKSKERLKLETNAICMAAVKQNYQALQYVKN